MPYDAPSTAMIAGLQAVRPQQNYCRFSEPGTIQVGDDGKTKFAASGEGKHRYLIFDPSQKDENNPGLYRARQHETGPAGSPVPSAAEKAMKPVVRKR